MIFDNEPYAQSYGSIDKPIVYDGIELRSIAADHALPLTGSAKWLTLADVNSDGLDDIVTNRHWQTIKIYLHHGSYELSVDSEITLNVHAHAMTFADFNGDSALDIAVTQLDSAEVVIVLGEGDGLSWSVGQTVPTLIKPADIVASDVNQDGITDLIAVDDLGNTAEILLGQGDGTFESAGSFQAGSSLGAIRIADLNGDGIEDVVTLGGDTIVGQLAIMYGCGNGSFTKPTTITMDHIHVTPGQDHLELADVNDDGLIDIVFRGSGAEIGVVLNSTDISKDAIISGRVFDDGNFDAQLQQEYGESGLAGLTVEVVLDSNSNKLADPDEVVVATALTDINGDYFIDGLSEDNYYVLRVGEGLTPASISSTRWFWVEPGQYVPFRDIGVAVDPKPFIQPQSFTANELMQPGDTIGTVQAGHEVDDLFDDNWPNWVPKYPQVPDRGMEFSIDSQWLNIDPVTGELTLAAGQSLDLTNPIPVIVTVTDDFGQSASATMTLVANSGLGEIFTSEYLPFWSNVFVDDFNGDGTPDIATLIYDGDKEFVRFMRGRGDGSFDLGGETLLRLTDRSSRYYSMHKVDMDSDGQPELILFDEDHGVLLSVNDDGTISDRRIDIHLVGHNPVFDDLNNDGYMDIAVTRYFSQSNPFDHLHGVQMWFGQDDGTFATEDSFATWNRPGSLASGDFNGDGLTDLVVTSENEDMAPAFIHYGQGNGSFSVGFGIQIERARANSLHVMDVDQDGFDDILMNIARKGMFLVKGQSADPRLKPSRFMPELFPDSQYYLSTFLAAGDLNQDNIPDLVTWVTQSGSNSAISEMHVLLGGADGGFSYERSITWPEELEGNYPIRLADLDNNGQLDIAFGGRGGILMVSLSNAQPPENGKIAGQIWNDKNYNGEFSDSRDEYISGALIELIYDANGNGVADAGEPVIDQATTDSQGRYFFDSVVPGQYVLVPDIGTAPSVLYDPLVAEVEARRLTSLETMVHVNHPPVIEPQRIVISPFATVGDSIARIRASEIDPFGSGLSFSIDSDMFEIAPYGTGLWGEITLAPSKALQFSDQHTVEVMVTAKDDAGFTSSALITLVEGVPFTDPIPIGVEDYNDSVVTADFNGDGAPDLAVPGRHSGVVYVHLNDGNGVMSEGLAYPVVGYPKYIASGDFNGDGIVDIAVDAASVNRTSILIGLGDGTFEDEIRLAYDYDWVGDINSDGRSDLINSSSVGFEAYLANDSGGFNRVEYEFGDYSKNVIIEDLNQDGINDLLVAIDDLDKAQVFLGLGDGVFSESPSDTTDWIEFENAEILDFNEDGILDILLLPARGSGPTGTQNNHLALWAGNGDGTFTMDTIVVANSYRHDSSVGDFNGDSHLDVMTYNMEGYEIRLGVGDGTFVLSSMEGLGLFPSDRMQSHNLVLADYNGDGLTGIAYSAYETNRLVIEYSGLAISNASAISGTVFEDFNRNDLRDESEPGYPGIEIELTLDSNGNGRIDVGEATIGTTTASVSGRYTFTNLLPGTYIAQPIGGYEPTDAPQTVAISVQEGQYSEGLGVPIYSDPNLSGTVFKDYDQDGTLDTEDSIYPAIELELVDDANGNGTIDDGEVQFAVTTSDQYGNYMIRNLPTGDYIIRGISGFGSLEVSQSLAFAVDARHFLQSIDLPIVENPVPEISDQVVTAPHNLSPGNTVGFVSATDRFGEAITFATDSTTFNIDAVTGELTLAAGQTLDFDGMPVLTIQVTVTDAVGQSNQAHVNVVLEADFVGPVLLGAGDGPINIVSADLDGDGLPDLASVNSISDDVMLYFGQGDGTFSGNTSVSVGDGPYDLTTGDFNNDGALDLAVANQNEDTVSVLLNNGDGTFASQVTYPAHDTPRAIATADLDSDGILDLIAANNFSDDLSIMLGNGDGTFGATVNISSGDVTAISVGDFNEDGIIDVVTVNQDTGNLALLAGIGDGTFVAPITVDVGSASAVTAGDLNGDGHLDLATANPVSNTASVVFGNGDGTFTPPFELVTGITPFDVAAGDINGDGILDLVVSNRNSSDISVFLGGGDGSFAEGQRFLAGVRPFTLTMNDFDGDGQVDVALAKLFTDDIAVLLNKSQFV